MKKDQAEENGQVEDEGDEGAPDEGIDAEAAFDEGAGVEAADAGDPGNTVDEGKPDETVKDPVKAGETGKAPATPPIEGPATAVDGNQPPSGPDLASLQKALSDTQAWATRMAQELAELKKSQPKPQVPPDPPPPAADDMPAEIREFYEDYPDMQKAVQFEAEKLIKTRFGDFDPAAVSSVKDALAQADFEKRVVTGFSTPEGQWIDGHPDAYKIMATPDFKAWWTLEIGKNPTFGMVSDPRNAIDIMTRYKTEKAAAAASLHDQQQKLPAEQMKEFASGSVPPGTNVSRPSKKSEESPDEIFNKHAS